MKYFTRRNNSNNNTAIYFYLLVLVCIGCGFTLVFIVSSTFDRSTRILSLVGRQERNLLVYNNNPTFVSKQAESTLTPEEQRSARYLQHLVQKSFHSVQYPRICDSAKFLVCYLTRGAIGFGARVHQMIFCHFLAYNLQRVLIVRNGLLDGLELLVEPLQNNKSCSFNESDYPEFDIHSHFFYDGHYNFDNFATVVGYRQPAGGHAGRLPPYLPGSVPKLLATLLENTGINPSVWYIGQSAYFLVGRLRPNFAEKLDLVQKRLDVYHPYVAMHIRHSDKYKEAHPIPTLEYMPHVESYFAKHHPDITERIVYVATDDENVTQLLYGNYTSGYKFINQPDVTADAGSANHNLVYKKSALEGLITDIFIMARSNFFVCTLSSNLGLLVHNLRQATFLSSSLSPLHQQTHSMDNGWQFNSPSYLYYKDEFTMAMAKRDTDAHNQDNVSYCKLTEGDWYVVDNRTPILDPIQIHFNPCGFAHPTDLRVFPLRTVINEQTLLEDLEEVATLPPFL